MQTTAVKGHSTELQRLRDNGEVIKNAIGGLLFAPVDFSKPGMKILDSATADGKSQNGLNTLQY